MSKREIERLDTGEFRVTVEEVGMWDNKKIDEGQEGKLGDCSKRLEQSEKKICLKF